MRAGAGQQPDVPALNILLTCEHASAEVPAEFAAARIPKKGLVSHRGWDAGALELAKALSKKHGWPLLAGTFTRLLIDLNRSLHHPQVLSGFSRKLPVYEQQLLRTQHEKFREKVRDRICRLLKTGTPILHLSIHSFTPALDPPNRRFDIGLLYDPARRREKALCQRLQQELQAHGWKVRRNAPYRGNADGHTTRLRREFSQRHYLGIEIECSQGLLGTARWQRLPAELAGALKDSLVSD